MSPGAKHRMRFFSVIVSTYNRKLKLKTTLDALLEQKYPKDKFEIIVSDDGSTDDTETMMAEIISRHSNILYIKNPHIGHSKVLNTGIRKSKGEIILIFMDDLSVEPTFIDEYNTAYYKHPEADFVAGCIIPYSFKEHPNIFARYEWFIEQFYYQFKIEEKFVNKGETIGLCPFSFKRDVFDRLGGLNESITGAGGEDTEFIEKAREKGYKLLSITTPAYHNQDYSLTGFLRIAKNRGVGGRQYLEARGLKTARWWFVFKFLATPLLFFKYWADFARYGQWERVDMVAMHTFHNLIASLYAAFAR
jgi:glycosyltransferase involved in cell wall biosynthesis